MSMKLSNLFGIDIYDTQAGYKGKIYDIIINLEKGRLETITTEPLKVKTINDAKKILNEKSIPYEKVISVKDIVIVSNKPVMKKVDDEPQQARQPSTIGNTGIKRYNYGRR
ncbi:MAG: PRC-barrel domain-containing protein [Candidatus ainarchaeum sp.]|nr:PRC-barrel domain-containing protein [Candidatus ainarchaeum sp.]